MDGGVQAVVEIDEGIFGPDLRAQLLAGDHTNKLREAVGDSADNPRYIETLPRRGYRFIAPVTGVGGATKGTATGVSAGATTRGRKIVVTVAIIVLAAGIAGGLRWRVRQAGHLTEKDTIVLGEFANSTSRKARGQPFEPSAGA